MSDKKGSLSMGFLGAIVGLLPFIGNGILLVFSFTKCKPAHLAVSAACLFTTILFGFTQEDYFAITNGAFLGDSFKFLVALFAGIAYVINAVFSMDFFYKYSSEDFSLFYPEGRRNALETSKKTFNGILGFLLGIFPIASSVSCFLLSLKIRNKPGAIISVLYLVSILFLMKNFGFESFVTLPLIGIFMIFSGVVFYNALGYKEEITPRPVSVPVTNTIATPPPPVNQPVTPPQPVTYTSSTTTTTISGNNVQGTENTSPQQGRIVDI